MILNHWMIVERYPKSMEWLSVRFQTVKSSLYLAEKLARWSRASYVPPNTKKNQEEEEDIIQIHNNVMWE